MGMYISCVIAKLQEHTHSCRNFRDFVVVVPSILVDPWPRWQIIVNMSIFERFDLLIIHLRGSFLFILCPTIFFLFWFIVSLMLIRTEETSYCYQTDVLASLITVRPNGSPKRNVSRLVWCLWHSNERTKRNYGKWPRWGDTNRNTWIPMCITNWYNSDTIRGVRKLRVDSMCNSLWVSLRGTLLSISHVMRGLLFLLRSITNMCLTRCFGFAYSNITTPIYRRSQG